MTEAKTSMADRHGPGAPGSKPEQESHRFREFLTYAVARPLLFVFWSLVLWGTTIVLAFLWAAVARGLPEAARLAWPGPRAQVWEWLNPALGILALATWSVVAVAIRRDR